MRNSYMKKFVFIIVFIAIALVGIITCPQKDDHADALMKLVSCTMNYQEILDSSMM